MKLTDVRQSGTPKSEEISELLSMLDEQLIIPGPEDATSNSICRTSVDLREILREKEIQLEEAKGKLVQLGEKVHALKRRLHSSTAQHQDEIAGIRQTHALELASVRLKCQEEIHEKERFVLDEHSVLVEELSRLRFSCGSLQITVDEQRRVIGEQTEELLVLRQKRLDRLTPSDATHNGNCVQEKPGSLKASNRSFHQTALPGQMLSSVGRRG